MLRNDDDDDDDDDYDADAREVGTTKRRNYSTGRKTPKCGQPTQSRREVQLSKHRLLTTHIVNPCKTYGNQRSERNTQRNACDYDDDPIAIMCIK